MYQRKTCDEYEIQGNYGYGYGYEAVTTESTRKEALATLKLYESNEKGVSFRIVKKRVKRRIDAD